VAAISHSSATTPLRTPGVPVAALTAMLLIAQQVAGKAARDALFLSSFRAARLPIAMAAGAGLSLAAAYWVSRLMARYSPAKLLPLLFAVSACGFGVAWTVNLSAPRGAAVLVYLQTVLLGPVMISTFWSLINERFDPHSARPAVARIASGGALGGVLGALATWRAPSLGTALLLLAALNGLAVVGALLTRARRDAAAPTADPESASADEGISPFAVLREAPFLRSLGLLVALGAAMSALLDYVFSVQAAAAFGKGQPLLAFFSLFWLVVAVLSFVLQLSFGRVVLEKLGLAVNVAVLPGIIILGGALGIAMPGLGSAALLRGAESVQRNTLFRSAYELLYTPVPEEHKRATKALIDVAFDRCGTMFGSAIAFSVLHAFSHSEGPLLLGAVVALALVTLPVTRRLHVGYVAALQQGLRAGAEKLELPVDQDAAERASRAPPQVDRDKLIEQIEVMQPGGLSALLDSASNAPGDLPAPPGRAREALNNPEPLLSAVRGVLSADPEQMRRALEALDSRGVAVACAILLLSHPEHHEQALQALRANAKSITGQLIDALLDPSMDFIVRRRLPRALNQCATQRAADGLLLGISDERFEVRYECGRALLRISDADPELVISRDKVLEAIQRELSSGKRILEGTSVDFEDDQNDDDPSLLDGLLHDRVTRSLEHVFTLLALHLEREPMRIAFRALYHEDTTYRGTALEYLNTVLPAEIRDILWPYLGAAAPLPTARDAHDLLAELAQVGTR